MKAVATPATKRVPRSALPPAPAVKVSVWLAAETVPLFRCACGGACPRCQDEDAFPGLQTKVEVSRPGDPREREADRVAERVMRMSADAAGTVREATSFHGEKGPTNSGTGSRPLHTPAGSTQGRAALRSRGRPLDPGTRSFMEARLGHDLSSVRVHTDARAASSARALDALAYTVGENLVFAQGRYDPASAGGERLLAHELAHVVQQRGGSAALGLSPVRGALVQRRTVRRRYDSVAGETGPICPVALDVTGAPEGNTEDLGDFVSAAMDGIRSACGSLLRGPRNIRVTMRYRRRMAPGVVSNEAYRLARVSVLGAAAVPPTPDPATERRARLDALYGAALARMDWQEAAEYLNGFNAADVRTRLGLLNRTQIAELRRGATSNPRVGPGSGVVREIDAVAPDAARVATLIQSYERALSRLDWAAAAEYLNGFNDSDVRARLSRLDPAQVDALRTGAVRNPRLGGGGRLLPLIDGALRALGSTPAGVGYACFDGSTVSAVKNGRSHSCPAVTGTAGAPTPLGRFCVRPQGVAQIPGGLIGRLFQDRSVWYLLEPTFTTTRFRMQLHPGSNSEGCVTVTDGACFDQLAAVLNQPGTDTSQGYDGYPPGNGAGVHNPPRTVTCVAWLDVRSGGGCGP